MRTIAGPVLGVVAILGASMAFAGAGEGSFAGASGHQVSGSVSVVDTGGGWEIRFGQDFSFDGAPDPRVGFGNGGTFVEGTDFEVLEADTGAQVYAVPAGIDPAGFSDVVIWCGKFSVPLGVAAIE